MNGKKVKCLGWCGEEFVSSDPCAVRFCKKCRARKDSNSLSKREMHQLKSHTTEIESTNRSWWIE